MQARGGFSCRKAVLIYGFDDPERPLDLVLSAFEALAGTRVTLGRRVAAALPGLVHPVFGQGRVVAWEVAA